MNAPILAYYRGDDGWSLDRAARLVARRLEEATGVAPERWREAGAATNAAQIGERVATAPMFGGGTVAIVVDPVPLLKSKAEREALEAAIRNVAPGNALVFIEQGDGSRRSAALQALEAAVLTAGGEAKEHRAPKSGELTSWIQGRARERGVTLDQAAARELARRVGAFVTEGDVDRQRQSALAVGEIEKLALYRLDGAVTEADVRALVPEVVPDSTWAFLDAVADRRTSVAGPLLDRLLDTVAEPIVIVQLARRLRELLEVRDRVEAGATDGSLVRTMGMKPYRIDKLVGQTRRWSLPELETALEGVLELDIMSKRASVAGATDAQRRLAWVVWVRDCVAPAGATAGAPAGGARRP